MDCPVCSNEPMIVLELNQIEIDYCLKCKGIWLDAGELELLLGNDALTKRFIDSFKVNNDSREKRIKCPICDKKMEKVLVGNPVDSKGSNSNEGKYLTIDRCVNGDGIWFDRGELEKVLAKGTWGKDDKVLHLLKDMFSLNNKQE